MSRGRIKGDAKSINKQGNLETSISFSGSDFFTAEVELRRKWRGWVRLARHRNAVNKSMGRCARTCKGSKNF